MLEILLLIHGIDDCAAIVGVKRKAIYHSRPSDEMCILFNGSLLKINPIMHNISAFRNFF